jgi:hypothetical protein
MQRCTLLFIGLLLSVIDVAAQAASRTLVVHEWGTFTSLQNEAGETLGGINTDDEPVPAFVHRISELLLLKSTQAPPAYFKGVPSCDPDVTMRLETPVLYFHLPPDTAPLRGVTVTARFRGGWLSEHYPAGAADAPGITGNPGAGRLRADTVGTLIWQDLEVGVDGAGPATAAHVWTAPRAVHAQAVRTPGGETEKFLFYRGVGHIDAPLVAVQDAGQLILSSRLPPALSGQAALQVRGAWLVDVRVDGSVAFRLISPLTLTSSGAVAATVPLRFRPADYNGANRVRLITSLRQALVAAGLFEDEARALLSTWELSYFKSFGLRVFFLVPREWTDFYLPLTVSVDSRITRVMVGRIELVTPEERSGLAQIGQTPEMQISTQAQRMREAFFGRTPAAASARLQDVLEGRRPLQASGVPIPVAYQSYLALGRFRNALVLDEAARHPTAGMAALISNYGLQGYQPAGPAASAEAVGR